MGSDNDPAIHWTRAAEITAGARWLGAEVQQNGVRFTVWAPKATTLDVELLDASGAIGGYWRLQRERDGVHHGVVAGLSAGARYRYRLNERASYPDPWSRSQPAGVHGPSEVVDLQSFSWSDSAWTGLDRDQLVIYEVHVGTYTPEGTFAALAEQLPEIRQLGVTAIELMPIAEFPGRRNWGYDGVYPFAPSHCYGGPAGLQRLVDAAHRLGLGVILDVVYNHFGPDGNYLRYFADDFFTARHATPWGEAINYDGPNSQYVRAMIIQNACYWLTAYHLDGLRLDATHAIVDESPTPVVAELTEAARRAVGSARAVVLIAEDARNDVRLVRPRSKGGFELDAVWADDFHHAVHVLVTGEREGYYLDYAGTADEVARTISSGFLSQGLPSAYLGTPRGTTVTDEPSTAFVFCIQNHDQIGNRAFGERLNLLVSADVYAVSSALLLLVPETPLLFMGQEFAARSPFLFFTDHRPEIGQQVTRGRRREFARFAAFRDPARQEQIPDPQAEETFDRSKLDLTERQTNAGVYLLYKDLLHLRRHDPVLSAHDRRRTRAIAIGSHCVVVHRWTEQGDRLIIANFGDRLDGAPVWQYRIEFGRAEEWSVLLSTADPRYQPERKRDGETTTASFQGSEIPMACALVLARPASCHRHASAGKQ